MATKFEEYPEEVQEKLEYLFESNVSKNDSEKLCENLLCSMWVIRWMMSNTTQDNSQTKKG